MKSKIICVNNNKYSKLISSNVYKDEHVDRITMQFYMYTKLKTN